MSMIDDIAKQLARHKLVPFFGAGLSYGHLGLAWKEICDQMADEIGLPDANRGNFLEVADRYAALEGDIGLNDFIKKRLTATSFDDSKGTGHLLLLSLSAGVVYTTNQDNVFELCAMKYGRPYRRIVVLDDLAEATPGEFLLIKYHGDPEYPDSVVFTGASYQRRQADNNHFLNIRMRADLLAKGFIFLGYSFQDPNVQHLFDRPSS